MLLLITTYIPTKINFQNHFTKYINFKAIKLCAMLGYDRISACATIHFALSSSSLKLILHLFVPFKYDKKKKKSAIRMRKRERKRSFQDKYLEATNALARQSKTDQREKTQSFSKFSFLQVLRVCNFSIKKANNMNN